MIIMLPKTKPLFLSIQPFDIDRPGGSRYDGILQFFNSFLCIGEGRELNEGRSREAIILAYEFHIEDLTELLEEFPDVVFFPTGWKVAHIHDQLDLLGRQFLLGGDWGLGPPSALAFLPSFLLVFLGVFRVLGIFGVLAVPGLSSLF